jgi:hypothetical protein
MKAQLDLFSTPLPNPIAAPSKKKTELPTAIPIQEYVDELPKRILISSDGSEVEFVRIVKGTELYVYKYTKGLEKVGTEVSWSKDYIKSQLKNYFRIIS